MRDGMGEDGRVPRGGRAGRHEVCHRSGHARPQPQLEAQLGAVPGCQPEALHRPGLEGPVRLGGRQVHQRGVGPRARPRELAE
eukprot:5701736-Lingulodinium_polyedra.AAC.1